MMNTFLNEQISHAVSQLIFVHKNSKYINARI